MPPEQQELCFCFVRCLAACGFARLCGSLWRSCHRLPCEFVRGRPAPGLHAPPAQLPFQQCSLNLRAAAALAPAAYWASWSALFPSCTASLHTSLPLLSPALRPASPSAPSPGPAPVSGSACHSGFAKPTWDAVILGAEPMSRAITVGLVRRLVHVRSLRAPIAPLCLRCVAATVVGPPWRGPSTQWRPPCVRPAASSALGICLYGVKNASREEKVIKGSRLPLPANINFTGLSKQY